MKSNSTATHHGPFEFSWPWFAAYLVVMALIVGGLFYGRQKALAIYGSQKAKGEWEEWRSATKDMASGPEARRVPKRDEPPALLLMRDRFVACLLTALLLTSVLFATFMILIRGAFTDGSDIMARHSKQMTNDN
jgi:hypothetical protein